MYTHRNLTVIMPEGKECVESQCIIFMIYLYIKNSKEFTVRKILMSTSMMHLLMCLSLNLSQSLPQVCRTAMSMILSTGTVCPKTQ